MREAENGRRGEERKGQRERLKRRRRKRSRGGEKGTWSKKNKF